jgi:methyl-accepting chemotaxis protein
MTMGANPHPASYCVRSTPNGESSRSAGSDPDSSEALLPASARDRAASGLASELRSPPTKRRPLPMLWRVFAANAAVFALAFGLLALSPVTIHARIRLLELVILLAGLVVMLLADLLLLREALSPLERLTSVMAKVDLLRPGQRAVGFDGSSSEVLALAQAFNQMLERLETERRESSGRALAAQEPNACGSLASCTTSLAKA